MWFALQLAGGSGQSWEANMAGQLPGAIDRMRQVHADWHATSATGTTLVILGFYTALITVLVYTLSH